MATRSSSNKGTDKRSLNVPPPARNTQDNTQAVRRMPDVAYGEQQALTEQQKAAPLPKDTLPQAQPMRRRMPEVDVFAQTQRPSEPVTSGLPFGAGPGAEEPLENTNDIIYEMYRLTGDSYLLNLIDQ
tara:strand:- start:11457 stop:11840 length:384 start_codon:yes stop_codon:yes gene_type:complete